MSLYKYILNISSFISAFLSFSFSRFSSYALLEEENDGDDNKSNSLLLSCLCYVGVPGFFFFFFGKIIFDFYI